MSTNKRYFNLIVNRVLIEHIGFYALSRFDHEMADVAHSMIVTVSPNFYGIKLPERL